ncbi:MAG: hypothetical protein ACRCV6_04720 [Formosimonas sp.]
MHKPQIHLSSLGFHSIHADALLACQKGLEALGYPTSSAGGSVLRHAINIVFCSQMLSWTQMSAALERVIVYNWEPAAADIGRFLPTYIRQMQHAHVWDYSQTNVATLKNAGVQDIHYVPMGYVPELQRIVPASVQDIDVLFYGGMNERRTRTIEAIRAKGLQVLTSDEVGFMSDEVRDGYIARAKVVLNLHSFEQAQVFEIARVSYLLANRKAVVAEVNESTDIEEDVRHAVASGTLDELPQLCWELVHDVAQRQELEERGFAAFSQRNAAAIMDVAMTRYLQQTAQQPPLLGNQADFAAPVPAVLNLRSGLAWRFDYCNVDARADFAADLPLNLEQPLDWSRELHSWRFGAVRLREGMFKRIVAGNLFSTLRHVQQVLTNCLLLLEEGGTLEIEVPLDVSHGAWSDVGTQRAFNEQTWERILEQWWQYGWTSHRFQLSSTVFAINGTHGLPVLAQNGNDWGHALKVPRAVDAAHVVLHKRALTADELKRLPQAQYLD